METACLYMSNKPRPSGYVQIKRNKKYVYAHRHAYESEVSKIPVGLTIDHLCKNRACVNTKHLEPVTLQENLSRRSFYELGKCAKLHTLKDNTTKQGWCRTCQNEYNRNYRLRKKIT